MKSPFVSVAVMTLVDLTGGTQGTLRGPGTTGKNPPFGQAQVEFKLTNAVKDIPASNATPKLPVPQAPVPTPKI